MSIARIIGTEVMTVTIANTMEDFQCIGLYNKPSILFNLHKRDTIVISF